MVAHFTGISWLTRNNAEISRRDFGVYLYRSNPVDQLNCFEYIQCNNILDYLIDQISVAYNHFFFSHTYHYGWWWYFVSNIQWEWMLNVQFSVNDLMLSSQLNQFSVKHIFPICWSTKSNKLIRIETALAANNGISIKSITARIKLFRCVWFSSVAFLIPMSLHHEFRYVYSIHWLQHCIDIYCRKLFV